MSSDLLTWAPPRLAQLLPLDDESLRQIITYSTSLSKEASAEHLKNLLGDSPAALEFIASFNSRRGSSHGNSSDRDGTKKNNKKTKAPLHSTGPPRRPENYGNVSGGYMKAGKEEERDYMPTTSSSARNKQDKSAASGLVSNTQWLSNEPATVQEPRSVSPAYPLPAVSSRNQSPAPSKSAASKNAPGAGSLISDMLPNVKSKPAKAPSRQTASGTASPSFKGSVTTNNIADLTSAIAALEMTTNPTIGPQRRKCNCYASIHPLFAPAPNCLRCGKIICSLEGLQPCSFCGTPLLSGDEVQSMIRELRAERGQEKMRSNNEGTHHDGAPGLGPATPSSSSSPSLSVNSDLNAAKAHRDRLLHFQAQNARRTRVVDEASDFETPNVASTLWMTPAQRALALKKQQRVMREMEEKARPEWEKKKTFMSLDIKGGKVSKIYHSAAASPAESSPAEDEQDQEREEEEEEELLRHADESAQRNDGRAFSRNPLLAAGGLFRPVWKAPEGKQVDKAAWEERRQKQTWRRVQDDRDDDEKWILDGGLHGFTT